MSTVLSVAELLALPETDLVDGDGGNPLNEQLVIHFVRDEIKAPSDRMLGDEERQFVSNCVRKFRVWRNALAKVHSVAPIAAEIMDEHKPVIDKVKAECGSN